MKELNELAISRDQSLAQMALAWLLKDKRITSVLVGASSVKQLKDNVASLNNLSFTEEGTDSNRTDIDKSGIR